MNAKPRLPARVLRLLNPSNQVRIARVYVVPWLQNLFRQHRYNLLSEAALRARRRSNRVFVFGSGYSINNISESEWSHFEEHDTLSFNWFCRQDFVRADYHLVREVCRDVADPAIWQPQLEEYSQLLQQNPRYADAIFLVHAGLRATMGNRIVGLGKLPAGAPIFRFYNRTYGPGQQPSPSLSRGLFHAGTLADCVNLAYLLGWKEIVLVGVDLYDRRYFWLDYQQTRADERPGYESPDGYHYIADATVSIMHRWRELFTRDGVELSVYNPHSLLAQVMPVYEREGSKLRPLRKGIQ